MKRKCMKNFELEIAAKALTAKIFQDLLLKNKICAFILLFPLDLENQDF